MNNNNNVINITENENENKKNKNIYSLVGKGNKEYELFKSEILNINKYGVVIGLKYKDSIILDRIEKINNILKEKLKELGEENKIEGVKLDFLGFFDYGFKKYIKNHDEKLIEEIKKVNEELYRFFEFKLDNGILLEEEEDVFIKIGTNNYYFED